MTVSSIKLLVVDDSALMRRCYRDIFEEAEGFDVRMARNGRDALAQMAEFQPDVITLDVNMPEMDGLTCLSHIMVQRPCPVVMVSSLTEAGAVTTLEALELGAVDYVPKPDGTVSLSLDAIRVELVSKVRQAARSRVRKAHGLSQRLRTHKPAEIRRPAPDFSAAAADGLVLIGVSTGGPRTLDEILPALPAGFPLPVVVAQHMPLTFTAPFARRLDSICALTVVEVDGPTRLSPGHVYIGRGDRDIVIGRRFSRLTAESVAPDSSPWHPSMDRLVRTAMDQLPAERLIGAVLTGMGNDGAQAVAELRRKGGRTIAESEETAVVFGMPNELIKAGGAEAVLPSGRIADHLIRLVK
jgi:two-component system chemotaxis response regulator CheB